LGPQPQPARAPPLCGRASPPSEKPRPQSSENARPQSAGLARSADETAPPRYRVGPPRCRLVPARLLDRCVPVLVRAPVPVARVAPYPSPADAVSQTDVYRRRWTCAHRTPARRTSAVRRPPPPGRRRSGAGARLAPRRDCTQRSARSPGSRQVTCPHRALSPARATQTPPASIMRAWRGATAGHVQRG
jgi:hypothetical protein